MSLEMKEVNLPAFYAAKHERGVAYYCISKSVLVKAHHDDRIEACGEIDRILEERNIFGRIINVM